MVNSILPLALGTGIPVGSLSLTLLSPDLQEVSRGSEHPPCNLTADSKRIWIVRPCPNLQSSPLAGPTLAVSVKRPSFPSGKGRRHQLHSMQREATAGVYPWATNSTLELVSAQEDHTSSKEQDSEVCSTQEGILTPRNTAL